MLRCSTLCCLALAALCMGWEMGTHFNRQLIMLLPPPARIALTLWTSRELLAVHTLATLKEMVCGFLLAMAIAFPLSWVMVQWRILGNLLQTFFVVVQCIPMFA